MISDTSYWGDRSLIVSFLVVFGIAEEYSRRETIEVNPVPAEIQDDVLEASVCKALSLTGVTIAPEDLHACHRMKRSDRVIIKQMC